MKKLASISTITGFLVIHTNAWAVCNADVQMNATPPTNTIGNTITNVPMPTDGTDVATKAYVDQYGRLSSASSEQAAARITTAAQVCADLIESGYSDWFLPSVTQLAGGLPGTPALTGTYWTTSAYQDGSNTDSLFTLYTPATQSVSSKPSHEENVFVCMR